MLPSPGLLLCGAPGRIFLWLHGKHFSNVPFPPPRHDLENHRRVHLGTVFLTHVQTFVQLSRPGPRVPTLGSLTCTRGSARGGEGRRVAKDVLTSARASLACVGGAARMRALRAWQNLPAGVRCGPLCEPGCAHSCSCFFST